MDKNSKVLVAGYAGMVGSAIVRQLERKGYSNILLVNRQTVDFRDQLSTIRYLKENRPDYVFMAAAKVGGILANNNYPAQFIYDNLMIQSNIISASKTVDVRKLLFLGSSCIYPKLAPQPLKEESLLTGALESTNEPYAIAKIAGIKLCEAFNREYHTNYLSVMPTNLYGPNDNYDEFNSHVIPGLIQRFHAAKVAGAPVVAVWGTGKPKREFLHVDDLADACVYLMENFNANDIGITINVGTGKDIEIGDLANMIAKIVGYHGDIIFDADKPDGTPRKLLDISKIEKLGWQPKIALEDGLRQACEWYVRNGGGRHTQ